MANINAAIARLKDIRVELDESLRLLGVDPEEADYQQVGTVERVLLHLQDIQATLYQESPNVDYAKALLQETMSFCKKT
ncbi:hypothetical protein IAQ67_06050 [Paenibacillus peoriae]|uniref:Uncharacterized protein n=1 Tax=Paenibacillus peoriae TaxID=59893 RepID=A0A7H0YC07_9BACL|nr:hypothetical protein [Paenibacillus peoriae]QNR68615.1 hypothetical protein IAQ67_06050 [Paenibacillus peoriae]